MKPIIWALLLTGVALNAASATASEERPRAMSGPLVSDGGPVDWLNATALLEGARRSGWGSGCYGVSVMLWLGALSRLPVSVAYPMLSVGYVVNAVAAAVLFGRRSPR